MPTPLTKEERERIIESILEYKIVLSECAGIPYVTSEHARWALMYYTDKQLQEALNSWCTTHDRVLFGL